MRRGLSQADNKTRIKCLQFCSLFLGKGEYIANHYHIFVYRFWLTKTIVLERSGLGLADNQTRIKWLQFFSYFWQVEIVCKFLLHVLADQNNCWGARRMGWADK